MFQPGPARRLIFARLFAVACAWHPAAVLTAAVFLLALLCSSTPRPEYRAEAIVLGATGSLDGPSGNIEVWLKSDEVLRAALINTHWPQLTDEVVVDEGHSIIQLRERLQVATLSQPDELPRLAITCTAVRGSAAMAIASELALQLAEHYEPQRRDLLRRQAEERQEEIRERLLLARDAEDRQRGELERLRHAQLAAAVTNSQRSAFSGSVRPSGEENLNPRWIELNKELGLLQAHRAELLDILQPQHPEMNGIDLRIAKVSGSLQKTPRQLPKTLLEWRKGTGAASKPVSIASQQYVEEPAAPPVSHQGLDPLLNMAAQIDEAAHQLSVAALQRKNAEWELSAIQQSLASPAAAEERSWYPQSSHIVKTGGDYASGQLWRAVILAMCGGGLVVLIQRRNRRQHINNLADILIKVPLPIVGRVELPEHGQIAPHSFDRVLRLITRCCEALVLGITLTCLAAIWVDPSLAIEFARDPLGAFAETARRML